MPRSPEPTVMVDRSCLDPGTTVVASIARTRSRTSLEIALAFLIDRPLSGLLGATVVAAVAVIAGYGLGVMFL